jgi:histone deacetylase 6
MVHRSTFSEAQDLTSTTGNGTHRAFNEDPSILYVSLHRYDNGTFYPGGPLGSVSACGEGSGLG